MRKLYSGALAVFAAMALAGSAFAQITVSDAELAAYNAAAAEALRTGDPSGPLQWARTFCRRGVPGTCAYVAPLEAEMANYQRSRAGAAAAAAPQTRAVAPSVAQRAPANAPAVRNGPAPAGQGATRTFLDPRTGRHCVTLQGWRSVSDYEKHLEFRNTCNLTFGIALRSPGLAPRGNGIGPNSTMYFTFVRSDPRAWSAEWSYEIRGGQ